MDGKPLFKMFGDCILIKPIINKQNSTTLIRQNEFDASKSHFGEVISVYDDFVSTIWVGDIVVFDVYSAEKFVYDGTIYYIAHDKDVFAVMNGGLNAK